MNQPPGSAAPPTAPPPPPIAPPKAGLFSGFSAMGIRSYQFYVVSITLQGMAESMQGLANGWYAYHLTGSTAVLGLTLLAQAIPQTLFSFVGGVVSDRYDRRAVWMVCVVLTGLLTLWLGISVLIGTIVWQDLVIRSFIFGFILALRMPARQGLMNDIVGREHIMSAVSLQTMTMNVMQFVGPATAGFLIALLGIGNVYFIMTGFYVLAALAQLFITVQKRTIATTNREGLLTSAKEGFKYIRRTPDVAAVLIFTLLGTALAMPYGQLLPAYAKSVLDLGPAKLGLLSSFTGVGALAGSIFITMRRPKIRGLLFIQTSLLTGVVLFLFCLTKNFAVAATITMFIGLSQALRGTLGNALLQTYTERSYLGRVLSIQLTQNGLSTFMGFLVAVIAQVIGVRWAVMGTAVMLAGLGTTYLIVSRRLRALT